MPRAPWRRRITTDSPRLAFDSPRPGGRRWYGLRRGGTTLARQVLRVRVGRRSRMTVMHPDSHAVDPLVIREIQAIAPVSPAMGPSEAAPTVGMSIPLLPGDRTLARRFKFAVVNACTLSSLGLGLLAIFLAMQSEVRLAAICLVACVIFDGLDGILARRLGVASPFGAQMDSLADMCSFGLAAPVVVYASLAGTVSTAAAAIACALVAGCAAIRLARFNVSPKDGRFFCGVPTTMAAAVLALAVLIGLPVSGLLVVAGVAILAFAMVSSFPYAKLARLVKLPPWLLVLPVVGALLDIRVTFVAIVVAYLASGPLLWLRQRHTV